MQVFQKFLARQQLIRKHSYLDHRYPGGPAFIPWLLTPGLMPQGGARGQNLGTFKRCFSNFLLWKQLRQIVYRGERGGSVVVCRTPERKVGGSKPTATVLCPWARHFTPRKYWLITQEAVAPSRYDWKIVDWDVKPQHKQTKIVYQTSVSLETLTYGSWSQGHHDLYFTVQWFCLISWRLFDIWTPYSRIMSQYDTTFDLKINVGHSDLYFMVQWFCLISWSLFDILIPYFGIMSQYDPMFDLK